MSPKFVEKVCGCSKVFKTSNGSDKCCDCCLEEITNGNPPEEGDFNTAGIVSGTLTAAERSYLQQDLESVENGSTAGGNVYEEGEFEERDDGWEFDERDDARYGHEG